MATVLVKCVGKNVMSIYLKSSVYQNHFCAQCCEFHHQKPDQTREDHCYQCEKNQVGHLTCGRCDFFIKRIGEKVKVEKGLVQEWQR
jgi:hypothetical protein